MELSPRRAVEIQERLGSDVAMVLDHVVPLPSPAAAVTDRQPSGPIRWAARLPGRGATQPETRPCLQLCRELRTRLRGRSARSNWLRWDFAGYADWRAERRRKNEATDGSTCSTPP